MSCTQRALLPHVHPFVCLRFPSAKEVASSHPDRRQSHSELTESRWERLTRERLSQLMTSAPWTSVPSNTSVPEETIQAARANTTPPMMLPQTVFWWSVLDSPVMTQPWHIRRKILELPTNRAERESQLEDECGLTCSNNQARPDLVVYGMSGTKWTVLGQHAIGEEEHNVPCDCQEKPSSTASCLLFPAGCTTQRTYTIF